MAPGGGVAKQAAVTRPPPMVGRRDGSPQRPSRASPHKGRSGARCPPDREAATRDNSTTGAADAGSSTHKLRLATQLNMSPPASPLSPRTPPPWSNRSDKGNDRPHNRPTLTPPAWVPLCQASLSTIAARAPHFAASGRTGASEGDRFRQRPRALALLRSPRLQRKAIPRF